MMYCTNCGAEIREESRFCKSCGVEIKKFSKKQETYNTAYQSQTYHSVRKESMEQLRDMYNYFSVKEAAYEELINLDIELSSPIQVSNKGKIWGLILTIFGSCCVPLAIAAHSIEAFIAVIIILGPGIFLLTSRSRKIKRIQLDRENKRQRMQVIAEDVVAHYNNYGPCPIGVEFTDPKSLEALYEVIRSGRADTLKEAINVLAADNHMAEMERLQSATAQAAWETCAAARLNAGFTAANYFSR